MLSFLKTRPPIVASESHHGAAFSRHYHSMFFLSWPISPGFPTQVDPAVRPLNAFGFSMSRLISQIQKRYKQGVRPGNGLGGDD